MEEKKKEVVDIKWSSTDGLVEFCEEYSDGSLGRIEYTLVENNNSRKFLRLKRKIEGERLGRIIN